MSGKSPRVTINWPRMSSAACLRIFRRKVWRIKLAVRWAMASPIRPTRSTSNSPALGKCQSVLHDARWRCASASKNYYQPLNGDFTTHRFEWKPNSIRWQSFHGHVAGVANPPNPIVEQRPARITANSPSYLYTGPVVPKDLNEIPIINLWMSGDNVSTIGPTDGQEQELIIHSFKFTPAAPAGSRRLRWRRRSRFGRFPEVAKFVRLDARPGGRWKRERRYRCGGLHDMAQQFSGRNVGPI